MYQNKPAVIGCTFGGDAVYVQRGHAADDGYSPATWGNGKSICTMPSIAFCRIIMPCLRFMGVSALVLGVGEVHVHECVQEVRFEGCEVYGVRKNRSSCVARALGCGRKLAACAAPVWLRPNSLLVCLFSFFPEHIQVIVNYFAALFCECTTCCEQGVINIR